MNYTLAMGTSIHQRMSLIKAAKPLDVIVEQPTTATMDTMVEHFMQNQLAEQRKLIKEAMVQQSILLLALSKGGGGTSVHQTVSPIMTAKPLDIIVEKPATDTMKMAEQILQTLLAEQCKQKKYQNITLRTVGIGVT